MKLFVYDHCPYCVRVMFVLGMKKIDCQIEYFLNDDEHGPISKVGSKQAPILQKNDGSYMPESMDIINYLDNYESDKIFDDFSGRDDLSYWINKYSDVFRCLLFPRWVKSKLPEFATKSAQDYFIRKKEMTIGPFEDSMLKSDSLIKEMEQGLEELSSLFESNLLINNSLSYDDIDIFSRLRGLTLVKGLKFPEKVKNYIDYYANKANIKLYTNMQI